MAVASNRLAFIWDSLKLALASESHNLHETKAYSAIVSLFYT